MKTEKRKHRFSLGLLIYAVVFLAAIGVGTAVLWEYMDAYERSRPHIALNGYLEKLDAAYVADRGGAVAEKIDPALQSPEQCRQAILQALTGELNCQKNVRQSTAQRHEYAVRCGKQVIGTMVMEQTGESIRGFTPWQVTEDSFDLSYLLTEEISVTVPGSYTVSLFGTPLGEQYISQQQIPYPLLQPYYEQYDLPYLQTYTAGPFLGEAAFVVADDRGDPVVWEENTDHNAMLPSCTPEQQQELKTLCQAFCQSYLDFTSSTRGDNQGNYQNLCNYMVPGGALEKRMERAIQGLSWIWDRKAKMLELTVQHQVPLDAQRYLCQVSYTHEYDTHLGRIQETSCLQLVIVQTQDGLRVESMQSI